MPEAQTLREIAAAGHTPLPRIESSGSPYRHDHLIFPQASRDRETFCAPACSEEGDFMPAIQPGPAAAEGGHIQTAEQLTKCHADRFASGGYGTDRGGYEHHSRVLRQTVAGLAVPS